MSSSERSHDDTYFHHHKCKNFKIYYQEHVRNNLCWAFPNLVSYSRFVQLTQEVLIPLSIYLNTRFGECREFPSLTQRHFEFATIVGFQRIVFSLVRQDDPKPLWGGSIKSTLNARPAFSGFKLHLVINDQGDLLSAMVAPGNTDDRQPVPQLTQGLFGKLYADKGYIDKKLRDELREGGVSLVDKVRKNMKPEPLSDTDAELLKKRMLIESVNKELKSQTEIQHTRHRSYYANFQVNTVAALIAYTNLKKKLSLKRKELKEIKYPFQMICKH